MGPGSPGLSRAAGGTSGFWGLIAKVLLTQLFFSHPKATQACSTVAVAPGSPESLPLSPRPGPVLAVCLLRPLPSTLGPDPSCPLPLRPHWCVFTPALPMHSLLFPTLTPSYLSPGLGPALHLPAIRPDCLNPSTPTPPPVPSAPSYSACHFAEMDTSRPSTTQTHKPGEEGQGRG